MREILFRGKRLSDGGWSYGNLRIANTGVTIIVPNDTPLGKYGKVDPETVGQFTGLTDKNGVKIFEGDVCRNIKNEEIVSVRWHGTMAGYVWNKRREDNKYIYNFGELFRVYDKYEVIGNIFDNPELMKGGAV